MNASRSGVSPGLQLTSRREALMLLLFIRIMVEKKNIYIYILEYISEYILESYKNQTITARQLLSFFYHVQNNESKRSRVNI